jgi:copper transport protein
MINTLKRLFRILLCGSIGSFLLTICLTPEAAFAHASFLRSDPEPNSVLQQSPQRILITFMENVDPNLSVIKVLNSQGKQVDNGDTGRYQDDLLSVEVTLPILPDGVYTVSWHDVSLIDGHSLNGSFAFRVGQGPPPAPSLTASPLLQNPAEPILRWIGFLSILTMVGSLVFELFVSRPFITASGAGEEINLMARRMTFRSLKLVWLAGGALFLASAGELVVKTAAAHQVPLYLALGHQPISFAFQTSWGHLWLARMFLLLGIFGVTGVLYSRYTTVRYALRLDWRVYSLVLAAGVLMTISLSSHGAAMPQIREAATFSDYFHLLAASFWTGGIVYLATVAPPAMKYLRQKTRMIIPDQADNPSAKVSPQAYCPSGHTLALGRFAFIALISAGVLVITGMFSSWAQVSSISAIGTPYGIDLIIKVSLVVALLVLGSVNFLWVLPSLATRARALRVLHVTVAAQAIIVVVVISSVGFLVSQEPARQVAPTQAIDKANPVSLKTSVDWAQIGLQVEPGQVGSNILLVSLKDLKGNPVKDASSVGLLISWPNADLGPYWQYAISSGSGLYTLQTDFNLAGEWQAEIAIWKPGDFDVRTIFKFRVLPLGAENNPPIIPSTRTGNILWGLEILLMALLIPAALLLTRRFRTRSVKSPRL